jgi:hypothetical protein
VIAQRVKHHLPSFLRLAVLLSLVLVATAWGSLGAETNSSPPPCSPITDTNAQALLLACIQLQEQLRATLLAVEQNRQEIKEAATQSAEALCKALQTTQERFAAQQRQDLEAIRESNKVILLVVGTFAALAFWTLLMMSYFQWRMSKGLAEISASVTAALGLGASSATGVLAAAGQPNLRFPGAIQYYARQRSEPSPGNSPASARQGVPRRAGDLRRFPNPVSSSRRRQIRPLRAAVIVGLICAAGLALLFYVITYSKLGFGYLHDMFRG